MAGSEWTRQRSATLTQVAVYLALGSFDSSIDNRKELDALSVEINKDMYALAELIQKTLGVIDK